MARAGLLTFGAVGLAAAVLAALCYLSLRQWEASAGLLLRAQARDMAAMAAEKVEMTILKAEEECLASLQSALLDPAFTDAALDGWVARTPLIDRLYLIDRAGRRLHAGAGGPGDAGAVSELLAEIPQGFWDRDGRQHLVVGGRVVLASVLRTRARAPVLAVLTRNEATLRREVLDKSLRGLEGRSVLAVVDGADRTVYASRPLERARRILTVPFGEALPNWRVALYLPEGVSPRDMIRRQTMIFTVAFALLLGVIVVGLAATYRLVRRESEMARLKSDFVANVSHDLKTPLSLDRRAHV